MVLLFLVFFFGMLFFFLLKVEGFIGNVCRGYLLDFKLFFDMRGFLLDVFFIFIVIRNVNEKEEMINIGIIMCERYVFCWRKFIIFEV